MGCSKWSIFLVLTVRVHGCSKHRNRHKNKKKRFPNDVLSECPSLYFFCQIKMMISSELILRLVTARATTTPLNSWTRVIMNINYWNHIESMAVVDGTQQIFPKNILSLFDFLNLRPDMYIYIYILYIYIYGPYGGCLSNRIYTIKSIDSFMVLCIADLGCGGGCVV